MPLVRDLRDVNNWPKFIPISNRTQSLIELLLKILVSGLLFSRVFIALSSGMVYLTYVDFIVPKHTHSAIPGMKIMM